MVDLKRVLGLLLGIGVGAMLLAGCSNSDNLQQAASRLDGTMQPTRYMPSPVVSTLAPNTRPLLTYQRTGGIAGINEVLTIEPDGRATLVNGTGQVVATFAFAASDLDSVDQVMREPAFATIEAAYLALVPDSFNDNLTWVDQTGSHTVTATEGAADVPPVLQRLFAALQALRAKMPNP